MTNKDFITRASDHLYEALQTRLANFLEKDEVDHRSPDKNTSFVFLYDGKMLATGYVDMDDAKTYFGKINSTLYANQQVVIPKNSKNVTAINGTITIKLSSKDEIGDYFVLQDSETGSSRKSRSGLGESDDEDQSIKKNIQVQLRKIKNGGANVVVFENGEELEITREVAGTLDARLGWLKPAARADLISRMAMGKTGFKSAMDELMKMKSPEAILEQSVPPQGASMVNTLVTGKSYNVVRSDVPNFRPNEAIFTVSGFEPRDVGTDDIVLSPKISVRLSGREVAPKHTVCEVLDISPEWIEEVSSLTGRAGYWLYNRKFAGIIK